MTYRSFRDASDIEWQVWEVHPSLPERRLLRQDRRQRERPERNRREIDLPRAAVRDDLRSGWLAFRSRFERRRRAPIPAHWEQLTDEALSEVLELAEPAGRHRRLIE